ncbi:hypothetical protein SAMN04487884_1547 [Butyrivibrio fibrisolvens]|uniref:Uncharacterized protein n=1 Tax=Butyrivibrio fibrisolvens TaxID=831 RepID=A0A1H9XB88_BUTFI|nr:hypothetical protein [Butyrivibrio fibrisolvens]SES43395.1 hypothetical protein SAMN04487884_1547 [Butyrivibrio fibrisolvens]
MPAKGQIDPTKKDAKGRYKSMSYEAQKDAIAAYDKTVDKIVVRLPKGSREKVDAYVRAKASEDPHNSKFVTDKGRPSVNALIRNLLENEMGITL